MTNNNMRKTVVSWFNRVRAIAAKGIKINGTITSLHPIAATTGKSWRKGICPKCGSANGFVFRSDSDPKLYVLFCQHCNKFSWSIVKSGEIIKSGASGNGLCGCGGEVPDGRTTFCYVCRPKHKAPKEVDSSGKATIY